MSDPTILPKESFNSKNGMLTKIWGPPLWHFLHTVSFNYPVEPTLENKRHYMQFIHNLQYILPCGKCRENLKKNFVTLPLRMSDMKSRHTFSLYIYTLHETVNNMLNKPSGLSYEDVRNRYEMFRANCLKSADDNKKTADAKDNDNNKDKKQEQKEKEEGCTKSLYHTKSRCIMNIIPDSNRTRKKSTLQIHSKCNFANCKTISRSRSRSHNRKSIKHNNRN
jgi:hypothetical protein